MKWIKVTLLIAVMISTSGYRLRCYWGCTNQTAIQNDYVVQRDECRRFAETKIDFALKNQPGPPESKNRKATLVTLFSECMAANGWNITDTKPAAPPAPVVPQIAVTAAPPVDNRPAISRSAECAFSRHSASVSSNAAARARACDLECAQRLQAAPDSPRPAACPTGNTPSLASGRDSE